MRTNPSIVFKDTGVRKSVDGQQVPVIDVFDQQTGLRVKRVPTSLGWLTEDQFNGVQLAWKFGQFGVIAVLGLALWAAWPQKK